MACKFRSGVATLRTAIHLLLTYFLTSKQMGVASSAAIDRGIYQLLCFRCIQAITADTVIAYITHDDRPNISSASPRHGAKQRGEFGSLNIVTCMRDVRLILH